MLVNIREPTVGPLVRGTYDTRTSIRLWGRGNGPSVKKIEKNKKSKKSFLPDQCMLIARLRPIGNSENDNPDFEYNDHVEIQVKPENDYVGQIEFNDLAPGYIYEYQMGFYRAPNVDREACPIEYDWSDSAQGSFKTDDGSDKPWTFAFSSCRIHIGLGSFVLFGSGKKADKIYKAIMDHETDMWMEIGDQVYYDFVGPVYRLKSLQDMRKLYQQVRTYPNLKHLHANRIIYQMCDDHDIHRDNTNSDKQHKDESTWKNGFQAFKEYQHIDGPDASDKLWYIFNRNNATFFVFDTRSERTDTRIISNEQMQAYHNWITDENNADKIKFLVSPTPVVSQVGLDSWFGFPEQQKELLKTMSTVVDAYILTGDAHCARTGIYKLFDGNTDLNYKVIEIMSSGLYSVTGDKGKQFNESISSNKKFSIESYDKNNNFPHTLDNTAKKGIKLVTTFATKTWPEIKSPYGIRLNTKFPTGKRIDCIFSTIDINEETITVNVFNQNNDLLDSIEINRNDRD